MITLGASVEGGVESGGGYADRAESDEVTRLIVLVTLFLAGLHLRSAGGISLTLAVALVTVPMWWRHIARIEFARLILGVGAAAIVAGFYLANSSSAHHRISRSAQREAVLLLLAALAVLVVVLWARAHFALHVVAFVYGLGDLANALFFTNQSWKYYLALPTTIVVVGWLGKHRPQLPVIAALGVLGVITALDRGRSFFAFCLLAACMLAWQALPAGTSSRTRRWTPALLLLLAGVAVYNLAIVMLTSGYLGQEAQDRTVTQIETSGSLLLGGRPQWTATQTLMRENPWGYGLGVVPNTHDFAVVKAGFESIGLHEEGYIRNHMLDGQFRLHSITADLWVRYGLLGLALSLTMAFALVRTLSTLVARRQCPPIVALMVILGLWYLAFEPTLSYSRDVFFAVAITLLPRAHRPDAAADPPV